MMKNTQILVFVLVLAVVALIHIPVCSQSDSGRYEIRSSGPYVIRVDSVTGDAWLLNKDDLQWEKVKNHNGQNN